MRTTRKALSVLLAVVMTLSCMSTCFSVFAAQTGAVSDAQWDTLTEALKQDSVRDAAFSKSANNYEVNDPDGKVLAAVEAYWTVFDLLSDKAPDGSSAGNRTINQVNDTIKATVSGKMNDAYTEYNTESFLNSLLAGATVSSSTGTRQEKKNDTSVPGTNLSAVADVNITVKLDSAILAYKTLDELPAQIVTSKIFTIKHTNTKYDYSEETKSETSGCSTTNNTYRYYSYYYSISEVSSADGATLDTQELKDHLAVLQANQAVFDADMSGLVAMGTEALVAAQTAIKDAYNCVIGTFSSTVWDHFYSAYNVVATSSNIDTAKNIISYETLTKEIAALCETDYSAFTKSELQELYNTLSTKLTSYSNAPAGVKDYYDPDRTGEAEANRILADIKVAMQLAEIRDLKVKIENDAEKYVNYSEAGIADGTVTSAMLTAALSTMTANRTLLKGYPSNLVAQVYEMEYEAVISALDSVVTRLEELGAIAGWNDQFVAKYNKFASEIHNVVDISSDSATLRNDLKGYDAWYSEFKALIEEMRVELGDAIADELYRGLDAEVKDFMELAYNTLDTRVTVQIDDATAILNSIKAEYGDIGVAMANISSYREFVNVIKLIDRDTYNYLLSGTANHKLAQETIDKYNALQNVIVAVDEFEASYGFSNFVTSTVDEIVRPESDDEIAREGDYTVTDENVEKVIDLIDSLLNNEAVKELLGGLLAKEGEEAAPFDLAAIIDDALKGIYKDDIINAIIQYVYPIVAKEFAKVWAGLPEDVTLTVEDVEVLGSKKDVDVNCDLYIDAVEKATAAVGIWTYPVQLGELIAKEYPEYSSVANTLKSVKTASNYDLSTDTFTNPWDDEALYVTDEKGNKKLNLNWGVTDRDSFIDAAVAALSGLENMLLALVSNIAYDNNVKMPENAGSYRGAKIGTGSGTAQVKIVINLTLDMTLDPISLVFRCSANDGYDNVIAPLFELLGVPAEEIPHGETLTSTRKLLENGIFGMLDKVIAMLAAKPVDTILNLLPNLVYAVEAGMIQDILGLLKTDITYDADATYSVNAYLTTINDTLQGALKSEEPIKINIGEMVNLADLGLDVSSFSAVWDMITKAIGLELPCPKSGVIATMGELTWVDTNRSASIYTPKEAGKAAHIKANRADLLLFLLDYVFTYDIIGKFVDVENAEGILKEILTSITANSDMTVAAVVELLNAIEYDTLENYTWYDGKVGGTVEGLTPAMSVYMSTNNSWNKSTADYIVNNINEILNGVLTTAGLELDVSAELKSIIDGLFTNKNITAIAKLLGGIKLDAEIATLLDSLVGINLGEFAQYAEIADDYDWGFTDGDREGFVKALVALIDEFTPVLEFLLDGENLSIADGEVELIGYDGYDSAIIPLLEALGASTEKTGDSTLESIINSLIARIAEIEADPINGILDLIPGIIYYLASDGLTTGVRNLLQGVYVILDTIKPIYDLELNALLSSLTKDLGVNINLDDLGVSFVTDLVEGLTGFELDELKTLIYDVCKVIGVDYESASSLIGVNGKKGAYIDGTFDKADMVTVILSFALDFLKAEGNAAKLDEMLGTDGIVNSLLAVFEGTDPEAKKINWMYYFGEDTDFTDYDFSSGVSIQPTMSYLNYPTNWTEETAKYVDENLADIVNKVIGLVDENYATLGDFINDKIVIYSTENVQAIVDALAGILESVDTTLLEAAGMLLDADINELKAYKAPEGIDTAEEFAAALTEILAQLDGLVNWLLFDANYTFFSSADGSNAITIYGAEGYAKGLGPILEALGVVLPEGNDVEAILNAVFARVDAILADPINEVLDILPNVIYFINADGLTVSIENLLGAVYALLDSLAGLGVKLDINALVGDAISLDLSDISVEAIVGLVERLTKLDLSPMSILYGLCVGTIKSYMSISGEYAYKMVYDDDLTRYDVITIIATLVLEMVKLESNKAPLTDMLGEDAYTAIVNFFDMYEVPMQDMSYILTDKADTDYVFSAISSSELYGPSAYGSLYTEEMAQYTAENFGEFADNVIYLLGLEIIEGENVDNLTDLLNDLVGGSVYNSDIAYSIVNALKNLTVQLEGLANGAGKHIVQILKTSIGVDLTAYNTMTFEEFKDDRAKFEEAVIKIAQPILPLLNWLLGDEDFTFFADENNEVLITLKGAEGYSYGIIPILEVLDCKDIVKSVDYYDAIKADETVLISSILTPLLDRIDVILANPAEEILSMLPNLIYFINSNGVDTVVKNTLNAVYTVLNAIEPIAKIDLYEIIGLDLATLDFNKLFEMILDLIAESTGYEFSNLDANAIAELSVGKLVSYESANGKTAYKMVYQAETAKTEMVTVTERLILTFIMHENNREALIGLLKDNLGMDETAEKYVRGILDLIADLSLETQLGMQQALTVIYYVFYGIDTGVGEVAGGMNDLNTEWQNILVELGKTVDGKDDTLGNAIADFLETYFDDIFTAEGIAPNGLIAFFTKIMQWFTAITDFFKMLFN